MKHISNETIKKILATLTVVILVAIIGQVVSVISFNQKVHVSKGPDEKSSVHMQLADRKDSTSKWVKRDYDLYGEKVDLNANTIDGTLFNNSSEEITSWKMRINIQNDCFINNAWCGVMEIHQNAGSRREVVQKVDLRNYKLEDIKLKYLYDGDLLIPLSKGDYLIYYPSEKDDEYPITANSELTIGMIMYYLHDIDLSDYRLEYHYHKTFTEGAGFYIILVLTAIWVVLLISMQVAKISFKMAEDEMKIRMSGISYVSDIYDIIYIIDIENDELTPLTADDDSEKKRPIHMGARDQLLNLFAWDTEDSYYDIMQEFADIRTLDERLVKESIACEYYSKSKGWSLVRFFAMDRTPDQPLKKVLFTIQNIQEEKNDTEEKTALALKSDKAKKSKSVFFDVLSDRLEESVKEMMESSAKLNECENMDQIAGISEDICQTGTQLLVITEKLKAASDIYSGTMHAHSLEYSFGEMLKNVFDGAEASAEEKGLDLAKEVSSDIPDDLFGDSARLQQVLQYLITNSIDHTDNGSVTISIFGKRVDKRIHLLFSIKDTGRGIKDADLNRLKNSWARPDQNWNFTKEEPGIGLTLIHEMLSMMGSKLNVISTYGEGSEFYFEIEQDIIEDKPSTSQ